MRYFAIRRKQDGHFLPQRSRRRGFTHSEPQKPSIWPPRLFTRKQDAAAALRWWLKGETFVRMVGGGWDGDYDEDWSTEARPDRRAEDMEIVRVIVACRDGQEG